MDRIEVKSKLKGIIRSMILSEPDIEIPESLAHEILQNYGCAIGGKSNEKDGLDIFVKNLQKWIEENHEGVSQPEPIEEVNFDMNIFNEYIQAEKEYCEVTLEVTKVLEEVIKQKEVHSEYFKNECSAQEINLEVLSKKCEFMKQQLLLKLYGEDDALKGHIMLRKKLKEELDMLKKKYNELVEYNKQMSEIKNDKTFCDLFKVYKELKKIEKKTEIISTM